MTEFFSSPYVLRTSSRYPDFHARVRRSVQIICLGTLGTVSVYLVMTYLGDVLLFGLASVQLFLLVWPISRMFAAVEENAQLLLKVFIVASWVAALTVISIIFGLLMADGAEEFW